MGIKIKKPPSPKAVAKAFSSAGKAVAKGVVSAGKGVASAGKALGKCKPGDIKCASEGMANLALATTKVAVAVSPAAVTYVAANQASGGKIGKGLNKVSQSVIGVNPNDLASGDIKKVGKAVGKGLYKVSGAETAVTAGKALAKCKPKDAACIAKNLAQVGSVALMYVPGAGGAAAVAMKVGQTAVKNAVKKEVEAAIRKKLAQDKEKKARAKLAAATSDEERRQAQAEIDGAQSEVSQANTEMAAVSQEKVASEKLLQDSATVVASQAAAKEAMDVQKEAAVKNPEIAAQVNAQLKPDDPAAQAAAEGAKATQTTEAIMKQNEAVLDAVKQLGEEPKIMGIPQTKFITYAVGVLFFFLFILIIKR